MAKTTRTYVRDPEVERAIAQVQHEMDDDPDFQDLSRETAVRAFQRRLEAGMIAKGWTQADFARACTTAAGEDFPRDKIHSYMKDKKANLPRPPSLDILSRALGVSRETLMPSRERLRKGMRRKTPSVEISEAGSGNAWLHIDTEVEWSIALEIMKILKENNAERVSDN